MIAMTAPPLATVACELRAIVAVLRDWLPPAPTGPSRMSSDYVSDPAGSAAIDARRWRATACAAAADREAQAQIPLLRAVHQGLAPGSTYRHRDGAHDAYGEVAILALEIDSLAHLRGMTDFLASVVEHATAALTARLRAANAVLQAITEPPVERAAAVDDRAPAEVTALWRAVAALPARERAAALALAEGGPITTVGLRSRTVAHLRELMADPPADRYRTVT